MEQTVFGRYVLLEPIARGGMALVYRAVLRSGSGFAKQVALKRILKQLSADPDFVARFADEAGIASTLSHGNIVQVFDFGEVEGEHYLAMELVDGLDLGALLAACVANRETLDLPAALYIGAAIGRGLGAAHNRLDGRGDPAPVVHRDVSPQNVLLSRAGEVKVTDFGIAKAADKAFRTRTGMVLGKCRYMAPEQAVGQAVDARSDVFAAGALLWEMLVGRPLFVGETMDQILAQVVQGEVPLPSGTNPTVPPEVDAALLQALDRDPAARHPDGDALARDLERLLHLIAPEYTCDDLATCVRLALGDRSGPTIDPCHLETLPGGLLAGPTLADDEPSTERDRSPVAADAPDLSLHAAPTLALAGAAPWPGSPGFHAAATLAVEPGETATTCAAERSPANIGETDERSASDARPWSPARRDRATRLAILLPAVALVGLSGGFGLRSLLSAPAGDAATTRQVALIRSRPVLHAGWRIELRAARWQHGSPGTRILWLHIALERDGRPATDLSLGQRLGLLDQRAAGAAGRAVLARPRFWQSPVAGRGAAIWLLGFAGSPSGDTLRFDPPDGPPLQMRLQLDAIAAPGPASSMPAVPGGP